MLTLSDLCLEYLTFSNTEVFTFAGVEAKMVDVKVGGTGTG